MADIIFTCRESSSDPVPPLLRSVPSVHSRILPDLLGCRGMFVVVVSLPKPQAPKAVPRPWYVAHLEALAHHGQVLLQAALNVAFPLCRRSVGISVSGSVVPVSSESTVILRSCKDTPRGRERGQSHRGPRCEWGPSSAPVFKRASPLVFVRRLSRVTESPAGPIPRSPYPPDRVPF